MPAKKTTTGVVEMSGPEFVAAVRFVGRVGPSRPAHPILGAIKITTEGGKLRLDAWDYETHAAARVEVASGILPGPVAVDGKRLRDVAAMVKRRDTVRLVVEDGKAVRCEIGTLAMPLGTGEVLDAETFPSVPEFAPAVYNVAGAQWAHMIPRVAAAASKDDNLPFLTGVCLIPGEHEFEVAATDRYQLTAATLPVTPGTSRKDTPDFKGVRIVVPAAPLAAVAASFKDTAAIAIGFLPAGKGVGMVSYGTADRWVSTRTIDSEFIRYKSLFPEELGGSAVVESAPLAEAVKAVAKTLAKNESVRLAFRAGVVEVGPLSGEVVTTVPREGDDQREVTVYFNPGYLLNAVKSYPERVRFEFGATPTKPVAIVNASNPGDSLRWLIVPIRVTEDSEKDTQVKKAGKPQRPVRGTRTRRGTGKAAQAKAGAEASAPEPVADAETGGQSSKAAEPEAEQSQAEAVAEQAEPEQVADAGSEPEAEQAESESVPEDDAAGQTADPVDGLAFLASLGASARAAARGQAAGETVGAARPARSTAGASVRQAKARKVAETAAVRAVHDESTAAAVRPPDPTIGTGDFEAWAAGVARLLPGEWNITRHDAGHVSIQRPEDEAELNLAMVSEYVTGPRRKVNISVRYPRHYDTGPDYRPTSTVTMDLGAGHAAREIQRRVLLVYLPRLAQVREYWRAWDERKAKRAGVLAVLSAMIPGDTTRPNWSYEKDRDGYLGRVRTPSGRTITVDVELNDDMQGEHGYNGIKFTVTGMTVDQLLSVAGYVNSLAGDDVPVYERGGRITDDDDVKPGATRRKLRHDRVRQQRAAETEGRFDEHAAWSLPRSKALAGGSAKAAGHALAFTWYLTQSAGVDSTWVKAVEKATSAACRERRRTDGYAGQGLVGHGAAHVTSEAAYAWAGQAWRLAGGALAQTGNPVARAAEWTARTGVRVGAMPER